MSKVIWVPILLICIAVVQYFMVLFFFGYSELGIGISSVAAIMVCIIAGIWAGRLSVFSK